MKRVLFLAIGIAISCSAVASPKSDSSVTFTLEKSSNLEWVALQNFKPNSAYSVCFTPGSNCTQDIVTMISSAKKTIYVQAYSFTSAPIAKALVDAQARGVDVKVILDKSQYAAEKYSSSKFLSNHGIPVWIDYKPAIAHNKIMIIDNGIVITGSFNFTKSAQEKNAENLIMISDTAVASKYLENWMRRQRESVPLANYQPRHKK